MPGCAARPGSSCPATIGGSGRSTPRARSCRSAARGASIVGARTMQIETDRLVLRRPRIADAPDLLRFLGDGDAMRFTETLAALRACRRYLAGHECQCRKL